MTRAAARRHGLDPDVFERQIGAESNFNPGARSGAGALGIAQIMPATARGWGVDPMNPQQALDAAAKNMARYVRQYGSYENALRAYNAGPGAIQASRGYDETNAYVRKILAGSNPSTAAMRAPASAGAGTPRTRQVTTTTPGVNNLSKRRALVASFLEDDDADPLKFALKARKLRDIAPTSSTQTVSYIGGGGGGGPAGPIAPGGGGLAATATQRANAINQQRLPYSWGGGHGGKTSIHKAVPLDCSGAVSKVLGIDPRVSGDFASWGRAGDGGRRGVTIYSNAKHVLMKINGHFFGTSSSNPGGGAGWIPQGQISSSYLRGFTARHS